MFSIYLRLFYIKNPVFRLPHPLIPDQQRPLVNALLPRRGEGGEEQAGGYREGVVPRKRVRNTSGEGEERVESGWVTKLRKGEAEGLVPQKRVRNNSGGGGASPDERAVKGTVRIQFLRYKRKEARSSETSEEQFGVADFGLLILVRVPFRRYGANWKDVFAYCDLRKVIWL